MDPENAKKYYREMLNGLYGLLDDFAVNEVPENAKLLLEKIIEICRADYESRVEKY